MVAVSSRVAVSESPCRRVDTGLGYNQPSLCDIGSPVARFCRREVLASSRCLHRSHALTSPDALTPDVLCLTLPDVVYRQMLSCLTPDGPSAVGVARSSLLLLLLSKVPVLSLLLLLLVVIPSVCSFSSNVTFWLASSSIAGQSCPFYSYFSHHPMPSASSSATSVAGFFQSCLFSLPSATSATACSAQCRLRLCCHCLNSLAVNTTTVCSLPPSSCLCCRQADFGASRTENVPVQVITIRLTKENYLQWSVAISMGIAGQGRIAYVNGRKVEPVETSAAWDIWFLEGNQVKTWIVNSVSSDIQPLILRKRTARDMWVILKQMYDQTKKIVRVYQLMEDVYALWQGDLSMADFYAALKSKWEELDYYSNDTWNCPQDQKQVGTLLYVSEVAFMPGGVGRIPLPIPV
ncbi:hypothetical protein EJ110_NYTH27542 [Nymphaea thermarum]|nr:hypothetical protein EJ110_NYTH27542 [Nymphaea thermarum]